MKRHSHITHRDSNNATENSSPDKSAGGRHYYADDECSDAETSPADPPPSTTHQHANNSTLTLDGATQSAAGSGGVLRASGTPSRHESHVTFDERVRTTTIPNNEQLRATQPDSSDQPDTSDWPDTKERCKRKADSRVSTTGTATAENATLRRADVLSKSQDSAYPAPHPLQHLRPQQQRRQVTATGTKESRSAPNIPPLELIYDAATRLISGDAADVGAAGPAHVDPELVRGIVADILLDALRIHSDETSDDESGGGTPDSLSRDDAASDVSEAAVRAALNAEVDDSDELCARLTRMGVTSGLALDRLKSEIMSEAMLLMNNASSNSAAAQVNDGELKPSTDSSETLINVTHLAPVTNGASVEQRRVNLDGYEADSESLCTISDPKTGVTKSQNGDLETNKLLTMYKYPFGIFSLVAENVLSTGSDFMSHLREFYDHRAMENDTGEYNCSGLDMKHSDPAVLTSSTKTTAQSNASTVTSVQLEDRATHMSHHGICTTGEPLENTSSDLKLTNQNPLSRIRDCNKDDFKSNSVSEFQNIERTQRKHDDSEKTNLSVNLSNPKNGDDKLCDQKIKSSDVPEAQKTKRTPSISAGAGVSRLQQKISSSLVVGQSNVDSVISFSSPSRLLSSYECQKLLDSVTTPDSHVTALHQRRTSLPSGGPATPQDQQTPRRFSVDVGSLDQTRALSQDLRSSSLEKAQESSPSTIEEAARVQENRLPSVDIAQAQEGKQCSTDMRPCSADMSEVSKCDQRVEDVIATDESVSSPRRFSVDVGLLDRVRASEQHPSSGTCVEQESANHCQAPRRFSVDVGSLDRARVLPVDILNTEADQARRLFRRLSVMVDSAQQRDLQATEHKQKWEDITSALERLSASTEDSDQSVQSDTKSNLITSDYSTATRDVTAGSEFNTDHALPKAKSDPLALIANTSLEQIVVDNLVESSWSDPELPEHIIQAIWMHVNEDESSTDSRVTSNREEPVLQHDFCSGQPPLTSDSLCNDATSALHEVSEPEDLQIKSRDTRPAFENAAAPVINRGRSSESSSGGSDSSCETLQADQSTKFHSLNGSDSSVSELSSDQFHSPSPIHTTVVKPDRTDFTLAESTPQSTFLKSCSVVNNNPFLSSDYKIESYSDVITPDSDNKVRQNDANLLFAQAGNCANTKNLPFQNQQTEKTNIDKNIQSDPVRNSTYEDHKTKPLLTQIKDEDRRIFTSELRDVIAEKEIIESQMRKLRMENSSLLSENKVLKNRYNRALNQIENLEKVLANCENSSDEKRESQTFPQTSHLEELEELRLKSRQHEKQVERLKYENSVLEEQLESARKVTELVHQSTDRSKVIECYRNDIAALSEELKKVKTLLTNSEKQLEQECERRRDACAQVVQLTDMRSQLEQQVSQSAAATALLNQKLRDDKVEFVKESDKYKTELADVNKMKTDLERSLKSTISDLTVEKNECNASIKNLTDLSDSLKVENDFLRNSLRSMGGLPPEKLNEITTWEGQTESLRAAARAAESRAERAERAAAAADGERQTLAAQLRAKTISLEEALDEIERVGNAHVTQDDLADRRQAKIDKMNADVRALRAELEERDAQILSLKVQSNTAEDELQRSKRQLIDMQHREQQLLSQLDDLQSEVGYSTNRLDRLESSESDTQIMLRALQENLKEANKDFTKTNMEMKQLEVKLAQERERSHLLSSEIGICNEALSGGISELASQVSAPGRGGALNDTSTNQHEQNLLKFELQKSKDSIDQLINENSVKEADIRKLRQDLTTEQSQLRRVATDKLELEMKLKFALQERNRFEQQRDLLENDLHKYGSRIQHAIDDLETEKSPNEIDLINRYQNQEHSTKQMVVDLVTAQKLLRAREREINLLKDTTDRQKAELNTQQHKFNILKDEMTNNRNDIERLTTELNYKMKENSVAMDNVEILTKEKLKLQDDLYNAVRKQEVERNFGESVMQNLNDKCAQTDFKSIACEIEQLKNKIESMKADNNEKHKTIKLLNDTVASLSIHSKSIEQDLLEKVNSLNQNQTTSEKMREQLISTSHQLDNVKLEFDHLNQDLSTEQKINQMIKEQNKKGQIENQQLSLHVQTLKQDLYSMKTNLKENRKLIDQYKKDKQSLIDDVQELCNKLSNKENEILQLKDRAADADIDHQREFSAVKAALQLQKDNYEEKIKVIDNEIKQKDYQIEICVQTNRDLEKEKLGNHGTLERLAVAENKLSEVLSENERLSDKIRRMKSQLEQTRVEGGAIKDGARNQREELIAELNTMKLNLTETQHQGEVENRELRELLNLTEMNLKSTEASLKSQTQTNRSLAEGKQALEKSNEELRSKLHEETTQLKLAEQNLASVRDQLAHIKSRKSNVDSRNTEQHTEIIKLETELTLTKEKYTRLKKEMVDSDAKVGAQSSQIQSLQLQLSELREEADTLTNQLKVSKHNHEADLKKTALEFQNINENFSHERMRLLADAKKWSSDFDRVRDQLTAKSEEILVLKENLLTAEQDLKESNLSEKQIQELLRVEKENSQALEKRFQSLQLELNQLKLSRNSTADSEEMNERVNNMVLEMTNKLRADLEQQHREEADASSRQIQRLEDLKAKISSLESELSQEQALHTVTKTQLASIEDDNSRLRNQLQIMRKRINTPSITEDKSKSRVDEINEIIAASHARAQHMVAASANLRHVSPDTLHSLTTYNSSMPINYHHTSQVPPTPPSFNSPNMSATSGVGTYSNSMRDIPNTTGANHRLPPTKDESLEPRISSRNS